MLTDLKPLRREHRLQGLVDRLDAVDGLLDLGVDVLHAQAQAVEAEAREQGDLVGADLARVDLDRVFARRIQPELGADHVHQLRELRLAEEGRAAASPVHLRYRAVIAEPPGHQTDLPPQVLQVLGRAPVILGDDLVAGAVVADRVAEGQVYV
jgi:hypothetical protein